MTLHNLINKVRFDDVFADMLHHVPEIKNKRDVFRTIYNKLRLSNPGKGDNIVIEPAFISWLGDGVHDIYINANSCDKVVLSDLLAGQINERGVSSSENLYSSISDEQIVADCLWHLVASGYPKDSAALSGYILNNSRRHYLSTVEVFEEIYSYLDLYKVTGYPREEVMTYKHAQNTAIIGDITPYSLPIEKSSYYMICFLDDYMWFNNETKTFFIISASEDYQSEVIVVKDFINSMMKNPTLFYGKPLLPGIDIKAIFITQ